ncbi:hypothetical protein [Methylocystis sp.]|uniref:hypothetical protein n=1 Tax=Methylocystis sp. TaxID=1911079 RepID=UPI0025F190C0|nr:hypothetical protein [Methylocystis sp.]
MDALRDDKKATLARTSAVEAERAAARKMRRGVRSERAKILADLAEAAALWEAEKAAARDQIARLRMENERLVAKIEKLRAAA